jgi:S1-C subfamily serine protease
MRKALFQVRSYFGAGTGFAVYRGESEDEPRQDVLVATAYHVVEEAMKARAEITLRHEASGRIFVANPRHYAISQAGSLDVAFCWIFADDLPAELQVVKRAPVRRWLAQGCRVYWMGYPTLVEEFAGTPTASVFEGIVSSTFARTFKGKDGSPQEQTMYVLDGVVLRGCSGAPAFRETGQVIGVVVLHGAERAESGALKSLGVTLAVPYWEAEQEFLNALGATPADKEQAGG